MADHGDQITVLLKCWLVEDHVVKSTPHWSSIKDQQSGTEEEQVSLVTIQIRKRIEHPPLSVDEGLVGMGVNDTRLIIMQAGQRKSGVSSLESMLCLPPGVCILKVHSPLSCSGPFGSSWASIQVKLLQLEKCSAAAKADQGKVDRSKKYKKQIGKLEAEVKELEAKLRISQDTLDKMFARRLQQSTIEELASLEEQLLSSYRAVLMQKAILQNKEEEKKKTVPPCLSSRHGNKLNWVSGMCTLPGSSQKRCTGALWSRLLLPPLCSETQQVPTLPEDHHAQNPALSVREESEGLAIVLPKRELE